ncbi:MAG: glucosyltransferase domain-containing protein [Lachnospiraceae bacterium]|nr:glucosyltransferase domain-containing protein [Lachnospiraceae bacterium]
MESLYNRIKEFYHLHKRDLCWNAIVCLICYGHVIFSQNVQIDTEHVINHPGVSMQWETIGRQGLLYTKKLLGLMEYNPYMAGVVFLGSFILLGSIIMFFCWYFSGKNENYSYGFLGILFSTCPVWMTQFYFGLQRAEVVLGMIYGAISVFCLCEILFMKQRKIYWYILYALFGLWSFASYQGCVIFYISLCITVYLLDILKDNDKHWIEYLKNIIWLIIGLAIVYISYSLIVRFTMVNSWYMSVQMMWGKIPFQESLARIIDYIKCMLNWYTPNYISAYPLGCVCVMLLLFIFGIAKKKNCVMLFLGIFGLMITPFMMSIYIGDKAVDRTQFAQPLVSAVACVLLWGYISKYNKLIWVKRLSMLAGVVIIWISISTIFRIEYTEDVRYQEDRMVAEKIANDLYEIDGAKDLPIVFVGQREIELNNACLQYDMYGMSYFQWDYGATWRILGFMKTMGINLEDGSQYRKKAVKVSKNMNSYPEEGYISVRKKYVVVKLSDVEN